MRSSWSDKDIENFKNNPLHLRVYTSRLLGKESDLVLHGGGNTSVKIKEQNIFGQNEEILYVKGSGWDLATIEPEGFSPVKMSALLQLSELDTLSDLDMVKYQRIALTNPSAPNPSVEAILHAIIPFKFVDHTHADAVVTVTNTPGGYEKIQEIYGDRILIIPYVMPGFILAKKIQEMTRNIDWSSIEGMILMNHGVFTFHDDAKLAYENMINIVSEAEEYIDKNIQQDQKSEKSEKIEPKNLATIRKSISDVWGKPVISRFNNSKNSIAFSQLENIIEISGRGPLTPDHIIRTKRIPVILEKDYKKEIQNFADAYQKYFKKHSSPDQQILDQAPRWAVFPNHGTLSFGSNIKAVNIIEDITDHTMKSITNAEQLGGWKALPKKALFEMEYWSLEQAKLKKAKSQKEFEGKVAVVTGAFSGIGRACVEELVNRGAVVAALDINKDIEDRFNQSEVLGVRCDLTKKKQLKKVIAKIIENYGGIDMLVTNAGIFPPSAQISEMDDNIWESSLDINLTAHMRLIKETVPYLALGFDPSIVIIGSKNVSAPGPGASAYSVAKAGLGQLGRVAALELGSQGIRVNTIHPNAVFDTGIWNDEVLNTRAKNYKLTVEEYKKNNILGVEITSRDVAHLTATVLGKIFSKITGAQIPIDGGNIRVI